MEYHRVFYINISDMSHETSEKYLKSVSEAIDAMKVDNIIDYMIPVKDQPTKVEFINPTLTTKKQMKKDLDASVEELTSYLKDEVILIHHPKHILRIKRNRK